MKVTKKRLTRSFYENTDVVETAQRLLGKVICTNINGIISEAIITETEAYSGQNDKACHAHMGKFTKRTATMYEPGGTAYVYLCYGIHHLFNIVTNVKGIADAVLVRGVEPISGIDYMLARRKTSKFKPTVFSGPGKLSKSLGINKGHNGIDMVYSDELYIYDSNIEVQNIIHSTRIGIDYAEEDALLPWRFYISGNKFVSKF
ncbi:DNA-3-methyladenine glycosylase [Marivirga arenosa]|uniref:Putative 3-methyladenine DNA glycosylase n=1 Tax=Marivirga arenosa TaxID=3059076 RepID=A0AA51N5N4_9BACT|nr:DNA-3-methyladenine glycosylase [Marivirga sp. ABR2-2]WMN06587.1 DNA-3-methyladenine glycosylase [Marivirga sp. ABR2-2]